MNAAKTCVKCGGVIPADEAHYAPDQEERCHDCADYCDDPNCARCARDAKEER